MAGRLTVDVDRFLAEDDGTGVVEGEAAELARRGLLAVALQCFAAEEVALGGADGEADTGLVRVVLGGHVMAPGAVTLLQAEAVEGAAPGGDHPVLPARLPERVPQPQPHIGGGVQLPAEFADVTEAHRGDRDMAEVGVPGLEVAEGLVGEVVAGERLDQVAGERTPDADAAGAGRDVADLDPLVRGVPQQPVEVGSAVGADLEAVRGEPGHGEVGADAAGLVQEQGVRDRARLLGEVVAGHPLEEGKGAGPGDLQPAQRGHVVQGDLFAGGPGLGGGDRRPVARRPGVTLGEPEPLRERGVGLVPVRALPATALQEVRAELLLPRVEGAGAQRPRLLHGL